MFSWEVSIWISVLSRNLSTCGDNCPCMGGEDSVHGGLTCSTWKGCFPHAGLLAFLLLCAVFVLELWICVQCSLTRKQLPWDWEITLNVWCKLDVRQKEGRTHNEERVQKHRQDKEAEEGWTLWIFSHWDSGCCRLQVVLQQCLWNRGRWRDRLPGFSRLGWLLAMGNMPLVGVWQAMNRGAVYGVFIASTVLQQICICLCEYHTDKKVIRRNMVSRW